MLRFAGRLAGFGRVPMRSARGASALLPDFASFDPDAAWVRATGVLAPDDLPALARVAGTRLKVRPASVATIVTDASGRRRGRW
jgi:hypothetical protein